MMKDFILSVNTKVSTQDSSIQNLETQMGQLAQAISQRPQGNLPSVTIVNQRREGKDQCNAIALRSGKNLEQEHKTKKYEEK